MQYRPPPMVHELIINDGIKSNHHLLHPKAGASSHQEFIIEVDEPERDT